MMRRFVFSLDLDVCESLYNRHKNWRKVTVSVMKNACRSDLISYDRQNFVRILKSQRLKNRLISSMSNASEII